MRRVWDLAHSKYPANGSLFFSSGVIEDGLLERILGQVSQHWIRALTEAGHVSFWSSVFSVTIKKETDQQWSSEDGVG